MKKGDIILQVMSVIKSIAHRILLKYYLNFISEFAWSVFALSSVILFSKEHLLVFQYMSVIDKDVVLTESCSDRKIKEIILCISLEVI